MQPALFDRELSPASVLEALEHCVGADYGRSAAQLVELITGRRSAADERRLRLIIEALRLQGHRICAHPSSGYHLAADDTELEHTCSFLRSRAMTSLRQEAALRRLSLPELLGQLGLPLDPHV